jgi:hypothetical protein
MTTSKPKAGTPKAKTTKAKAKAKAPKTPKPKGRPSSYTVEVGNTICLRLVELGSLRKVCQAKDMPEKTTVFRWLSKSEGENPDPAMVDFRNQYARARKLSREFQFDEHWEDVEKMAQVPVLVDDVPLVVDGKVVTHVTPQSVALARLKHDAWKWQASKEDPKKYGDKITQEVVGAGGGAVQVEHTVDPTKLSSSALTELLAARVSPNPAN